MIVKDKVALITGASSGIGRAIAIKLSDQGCKIVLASRNTGKLKEIKQHLVSESMVIEMDVSQTESVAKGFKKAVGHPAARAL